MKSIVCEQPFEFKMIQSEKPVPNSGEALIRVRRIGICGTDIHAYGGNQPFLAIPEYLAMNYPVILSPYRKNESGLNVGDQVSIIPYMECGECLACRSGKTNCCTDMKVLGVHAEGSMSEWITVPYNHLVRTEGLTLDQSAMIEPLSIGAHAVGALLFIKGNLH